MMAELKAELLSAAACVAHGADPQRELAIEEGAIAVARLRGIASTVLEGFAQVRAETATVREGLDDAQLRLQAAGYEKEQHEDALRVIERFCEECAARRRDMDLLEDDGGEEDEGDITLRRLERELKERRRLVGVLAEKRTALNRAQEALALKRQKVMEADAELRKWADGSSATLREHLTTLAIPDIMREVDPSMRRRIDSLPRPLYVAFHQLVSAQEAYGLPVSLQIHAEGAGTDAAMTNAHDEVKGDPTAMTDGDLYEASPESLTVRVDSASCDGEVTIRLRFLPKLGIIVADAERREQNLLLVNLFPDDLGDDTPNTANLMLHDGKFVFDSQLAARPFQWAQTLGGLDFLPCEREPKKKEVVDGVKVALRENRATLVIRALMKRLDDQAALEKSLTSIAKLVVRASSSSSKACLTAWEEVRADDSDKEIEEGEMEEVKEGKEEEEGSDINVRSAGCRQFKANVKIKESDTTVGIVVPAAYPSAPARYSLSSEGIDSSALASLQALLNERLHVTSTTDDALSQGIYMILEKLDNLSEQTK